MWYLQCFVACMLGSKTKNVKRWPTNRARSWQQLALFSRLNDPASLLAHETDSVFQNRVGLAGYQPTSFAPDYLECGLHQLPEAEGTGPSSVRSHRPLTTPPTAALPQPA